MNNLIIDNHVISKDIQKIIAKLRSQITNGKLKQGKAFGEEYRCTCPFHKEGLENRPSCNIYIGDDDKLTWGTYHCFTCGSKGYLNDFVAACLDVSKSQGKKWLKDNFTDFVINDNICEIDDSINLKKTSIKPKQGLNEKILDSFQSWHPYLQTRKLSKDICNKFEVKYDPKTECIVFPVRDCLGKLSFLTRRSVNSKEFIIDSNINKEIYLLFDIIRNKTKTVYVVESQINALTLRSWGYPSIALFGTGTEYQYNLLKKAGIMSYILCFDGDQAGKKGEERFIKHFKNISFIKTVRLPFGKDVNDLSKEEFEKLLVLD